MENSNNDHENEGNAALSQETIITPDPNSQVPNTNDQQKIDSEITNDEKEQKNDENQTKLDNEEAVTKNEIDVNIQISTEDQKNALESNIESNHQDNETDKNDIDTSVNKEKSEAGLNTNELDKLFESTQQQKSIHKEEENKEINDDQEKNENEESKPPAQSQENIDKNENAEINSNEQQNIQGNIDDNPISLLNASLNHLNNPSQAVQNNTTVGQKENPAIQNDSQPNDINNQDKLTPDADLHKDPNIQNMNEDNNNNLQPLNNSIYSSSSYYDYDEDPNFNNNMPSNQITKPSNITNDNLTKNKPNFSALNPIYVHSLPKDADDGVPPALKPLIFHAKDSLTYQALCGKQIYGLKQSALTSIVNDLRKYVDIAVDHNLINEACHIQMCIDNIRNDHSAEKIQADKDIIEIDKKLQEANQELEERMNLYVT